MSTKPENIKVLVTRRFPDKGVSMLEQEGFFLTIWDKQRPMTRDEYTALAQSHNAVYCTLSEKADKAFLDKNSHLDIISQFGVGYDNIDVEHAHKLEIAVGNTPGVLSDATADVAFGLMIIVSRKMFYMHKRILDGEWKYFKPSSDLGIELKNKTLGIFGLGRIGTEMAKRCQGAYNMNVIYHNRSRNIKAEQELEAKYVSFDYLLGNSDVLSVHASLNRETQGIFDNHAFSGMKPTSIFINTARGLIHNEKDLLEALQKRVIFGAGLDVTNPEPMDPSNPLLNLDNVAVLPHIGSATVETRNKMSVLAAENIIEFYKGNKVPNQVSPDI
jgi:glyoxylate reductase